MSFVVKKSTIFSTTTPSIHQVNDCCTICRQSLDDDSIYAKEGNFISRLQTNHTCGHTFHEECVKPWLHKHGKCPICAIPMELYINFI